MAKEFDLEATFGKRDGEKREDFPPELQDIAFETPVGEVSEIIDALDHLFVAKVHAFQAGKSDDFDGPGVKEAAENAFKRHRREQWEKNYLEHLQKRIEDQ